MKIREPRPNIVEGLFYPSDPEDLKKQLPPPPAGEMNLLLLPHADWEYMEGCLQQAWPRLQNSLDSLLILGPVHREKEEQISLSPNQRFHTPLGDISLDRFGAKNLEKEEDLFRKDPRPHEEEHVLEIHLPMIKSFFPGVYLLPLLTGPLSEKALTRGGKALRNWVEHHKNPGILVSANLTGFVEKEQARKEYLWWNRQLQKGQCREEASLRQESFSGCARFCLSLLEAAGLLPEMEEIHKSVHNEEDRQIIYAAWGGHFEK